jgi:dolichyl-phosphate-mannose--protein O-mannosyl transferase
MCVVFFIIIPLAIYVLSYIPYMPSNPDKSLIEVVLDNQEYMYNYHANLNATHSYQSSWYSWIIDGRPIYYYSSASAGLPAGIRASVVSMGNPAIWWTGLACIIPALYFAWKRKEKMMLVVFIGYACQLFPWILVTRCTFIYHYFTAVPFLILMIVYVIKCLYEDKIINRWVIGVYLAIALLLYILFYPVMVGIPVKEAYIDGLRWFSTWSF